MKGLRIKKDFVRVCVHIEGWLFKTNKKKLLHISLKSRRVRLCGIPKRRDGVYLRSVR